MTELRPFLQRFALGTALTLWAALHVTPSFAIVGGEEASSSSSARRYTVIVQSQKGELCSGAVIARNLVLTAAHCVVPNTKYRVISFDQNFVPTAIGVAAAARNPSFKLRGRPDQQTGLDIAVLELSEPFGGDIKPLAISSDLGVLSPLSEVTVSGFGLSRYGDRASAGKLRFAHLRVAGVADIGVPSLALTSDGTPQGRGRSACLGDSGRSHRLGELLPERARRARQPRGRRTRQGALRRRDIRYARRPAGGRLGAHASRLRRRRLRLSSPARLGTRHWRGWRQLAVKPARLS